MAVREMRHRQYARECEDVRDVDVGDDGEE